MNEQHRILVVDDKRAVHEHIRTLALGASP